MALSSMKSDGNLNSSCHLIAEVLCRSQETDWISDFIFLVEMLYYKFGCSGVLLTNSSVTFCPFVNAKNFVVYRYY